jgi:glucose/arabinose dehydrogenase
MRCAFVIAAVLSFAGVSFAQSVIDPSLRVNTYLTGFDQPTGAVFIDDIGTMLVTEKNTGRVKLVENRRITKTVLDLPVSNASERGLLSIAIPSNFAENNNVYLFHSAASVDGGANISNKISQYKWDPIAQTLAFDRKIIDMPPGPGPNHNGGKMVFDSKNKLYAVLGDVNRNEQTTNFENSGALSLAGTIVRLEPNGKSISTNPFRVAGDPSPQNDIFAYGIRNSFGLAIDPVTGDLWDTENGPDRMDEINRVTVGFNSGWEDIMGPIAQSGSSTSDLVDLGLRANYQDPKLSWVDTVAPTDLEFSGSRLGVEYDNDLFVGDVNTGSLYRFDLTSNRKSLQLTGPLADRIVSNSGNLLDESGDIVFGSGFGVTSDLLNGPGGLFVVSLSQGAIYRISQDPNAGIATRAIPEPTASLLGTAIAAHVILSRTRRRILL